MGWNRYWIYMSIAWNTRKKQEPIKAAADKGSYVIVERKYYV